MVVRLLRLWFSFIILTIPVSSAQISPIYFKKDLSNVNNSNKSYTEIVNTNNSFINGSNAIIFTKKRINLLIQKSQIIFRIIVMIYNEIL